MDRSTEPVYWDEVEDPMLTSWVVNASYIGLGTAVLGLLGPLILVFLVRPVWSQLP
jgi:hypothetical protein